MQIDPCIRSERHAIDESAIPAAKVDELPANRIALDARVKSGHSRVIECQVGTPLLEHSADGESWHLRLVNGLRAGAVQRHDVERRGRPQYFERGVIVFLGDVIGHGPPRAMAQRFHARDARITVTQGTSSVDANHLLGSRPRGLPQSAALLLVSVTCGGPAHATRAVSRILFALLLASCVDSPFTGTTCGAPTSAHRGPRVRRRSGSRSRAFAAETRAIAGGRTFRDPPRVHPHGYAGQ